MGFGFNLLFVFVILPAVAILTLLFIIAWFGTKRSIYLKILGLMWFSIFGFFIFIVIVQWLTSKTELEKKDYYGKYIVDRNFFPGRQADWQYESFRFEIKENDSIYFYLTNKEKILKTYYGTIETTDPSQYSSERLKLNMTQPTYHIVKDDPTTYRSAWSFYLVFHSSEFNNVYFKKGKWKSLE
jgi:energy-coupling factor transporter transmembrane protein EcfT